MTPKKKNYVDYVVSDNPIFGKEVTRHFLDSSGQANIKNQQV